MGFGRAKEDRPTPPEVYNWKVYAACLCATLGSWMFGYSNGVLGPCLVLLPFQRDFKLPPTGTPEYANITANILSFLQIGALAGSLIVFPIVKSLGRRWALELAGALYFAGAAMQTFSKERLEMMYVGRVLAGLGLGFATVVVPMYIGELAPPAIRGSLIGLYEMNNQVSGLAGNWAGYFAVIGIPSSQSRQWQIPIAMQMVPGAALCISILVLPESPRWLVERGRTAQARRVLSVIRNIDPQHEYISFEIDQMVEARDRQRQFQADGGVWQLLKELTWPGNRNRIARGCLLMWGCNMTGMIGMNFYTPTIFESIGFVGTTMHLFLTGFYGLARSITTILTLSFLVDTLGRRKLFLVSCAGVILTLTYLGAYTTVSAGAATEGNAAAWVAMVSVYLYGMSFATAWNGVIWVYCSEIFPSRIREICMSLSTCNQWLAQFTISRVSPYMLNAGEGGNVFFLFFASGTTVSAILVYFFLPETKGRTLEAMDEIFGTPYKGGSEDPIMSQVPAVVRVSTAV